MTTNNRMSNTDKYLAEVQIDAIDLQIETDFPIEIVVDYIKQSCLAQKCAFIEYTSCINNICERFLHLLRTEELDLDEISTIMVVASLSYYTTTTFENIQYRSQFLQRAFEYVDTLNPMHLHLITKRIWEAFKLNDTNFLNKLSALIRMISLINESGRAIALCLTWSILNHIAKHEFEMHRFYKLNDLHKILEDIDHQVTPIEENMRVICTMVECLGFLINNIVRKNNDDFMGAGYREYFLCGKKHIKKLKLYADNLYSKLPMNAVQMASNNCELYIRTKEYIQFSIIDILESKYNDL